MDNTKEVGILARQYILPKFLIKEQEQTIPNVKHNLKKDTTVPIKILMRKKNENYPEIQDYFFFKSFKTTSQEQRK